MTHRNNTKKHDWRTFLSYCRTPVLILSSGSTFSGGTICISLSSSRPQSLAWLARPRASANRLCVPNLLSLTTSSTSSTSPTLLRRPHNASTVRDLCRLLTHPLSVCLSPSRRPAAPLPVVRLSPPSLRTSQGLFARPHRDSAWHKLWPFAQRGVVLKLAPAARSGSGDPPTQRLVVILPSPRRQTQSAILAASQGL